MYRVKSKVFRFGAPLALAAVIITTSFIAAQATEDGLPWWGSSVYDIAADKYDEFTAGEAEEAGDPDDPNIYSEPGFEIVTANCPSGPESGNPGGLASTEGYKNESDNPAGLPNLDEGNGTGHEEAGTLNQATTVVMQGTMGTQHDNDNPSPAQWTLFGDCRIVVGGGTINQDVVGSMVRSPWYDVFTAGHTVVSVEFQSPVTAGPMLAGLFINLRGVNRIEGLANINTSNATSMEHMFSGFASSFNVPVANLDLSSFNTGNVTRMDSMFSGANIANVNLSSFNTSNVTGMSFMFSNTRSLTSLDLSNFDTSNVLSMSSMFNNTSLTNLDLTSFDTRNVTIMRNMFTGASNLASLNLSSFNTIGMKNNTLVNMGSMFSDTTGLQHLVLGENFRFTRRIDFTDSVDGNDIYDPRLPAVPTTPPFAGQWGLASANPSDGIEGIFTSEALVDMLWHNNPEGDEWAGNSWTWARTPSTSVTVSFNTHGGSPIDSQTIESGTLATRPAQDPVRAGFTFSGWFTAATGGSAFDFSTPIITDTVIHAQWYNGGGGGGGGNGGNGGGDTPGPPGTGTPPPGGGTTPPPGTPGPPSTGFMQNVEASAGSVASLSFALIISIAVASFINRHKIVPRR